jgi:hypothetical protein
LDDARFQFQFVSALFHVLRRQAGSNCRISNALAGSSSAATVAAANVKHFFSPVQPCLNDLSK